MKKENLFWFVTATLFAGLLVPPLVQDGMFLDGVTYSGISKNMAHGLGTYWNPEYTKTLYTNFHEHPALFFIIQSFFFRVLGDGIYTERIFTFLTSLISATAIVLCWNLFSKEKVMKRSSWAVVFLWITLPIVIWSYKNNMLENLLSIFTLFAVYFISKSLKGGAIIYSFIGSIFILLAFLTKGIVGLFPLVIPFFFLASFNKQQKGKTIGYGLFLILTFLFLYFLITRIFPEIRQNITSYIHQQVLPSLNNKREKYVNSHFSILLKLLSELAMPLMISIAILIVKRIKRLKATFIYRSETLYFLLTALSASLPMIITLKQRRYYLVPSLALYVLSIGFFIMPYVIPYLENLSYNTLKWIKRITSLSACGILIFSILHIGSYSRDEEQIKDVHAITDIIPAGTIISTTKETWANWALVAYLNRLGNISLDCDHEGEYYLIEKENPIKDQLNDRYEILDLDLKKYIVLKRIH